MNLSERLADYAVSVKFGQLDARTRAETTKRVIDSFGCAVGALKEAPVKMALKVALRSRSSRPATLVGTRRRTSPDLAAFVNGLMVRYFDFNDTYLSKEPAHPSDNLSACLAVAESEGAGGKDLISALAVAYEVQCRLCDAADIRHRGWDHVNYGLVSTSLASSRLMGLDAGEASQAVNIALGAHIAMRQVRAGSLSMWKGASFSNAARNGVFAATLAREGYTGPSPIFEGEMGFFRQVSGPFKMDVAKFGGRGGSFRVPDTYLKFWPAEYHSQTAIWASLEVRRKLPSPADVESILVETHEAGYAILGKDREKWRPTTKETADHSLPFIVCAAIAYGGIDNSSYSDGIMKSPAMLELMDKTTVEEDPKLTRMYPSRGMPNRVTVRTKGGGSATALVVVPKGHPLNPMTEGEVEEKFLKLAAPVLGGPRAKRVLGALWDLESVDDLGELVSMTSPA